MKKVEEPTVRKTLTVATSRIRWQPVIGLVAAIVVMSMVVPSRGQLHHVPPAAPSFTVLYSFPGYPTDGWQPYAGLARDAAGNLYGTTSAGGASGWGVVFKLGSTGTETILHTFTGGADGGGPSGGLVQDAGGNLYGTTADGGAFSPCSQGPLGGSNGGCGAVFKLGSSGTETVLYNFSGGPDGANPLGGLIRDAAGNLYGTTVAGGVGSKLCAGGCGTVFKVAPSGAETVLHSFTGGADGGQPTDGLISDAAGNLYGTTIEGGERSGACSAGGGSCGVVFKLSPTGTYTVLHSFTGGADGGNPDAGLIQDAAGNLYGTTYGGGASSLGVVFELIRCDSGSSGYDFKVLHSFTGPDGASPYSPLVRDAAGNFYGTAAHGGAYGGGANGVVFRLTP